MDRTGLSDPYCVVSLGSQHHKTSVVRGNLSPKWTDTDLDPFSFEISAHSPGELLFEVFDWNRITKHKRMGRLKVPVRDLLAGKELDTWMSLSALKDTDKVTGELHISILLKNDKIPQSSRNLNPTYSSFMEQPHADEPPLFTAIKNSDLLKVQQLLRDPKTNVNQKDSLGFTPLHAACVLFSDLDDVILSVILRHKDINVNIENNDGNTPLHYFCQKFRSPNCADAFEIFIEKGANVNAKNKNGETPLHKAIFNNSLKLLMVNLLITNGADVNEVTVMNETALHYAVHMRREDLVILLLRGGAEINIVGSKEKKTALELAEMMGQSKMVALLKKAKELFEWLDGIQMGKYKAQFVREELWMEVVPDIDDAILDRVGITPAGHRLRIQKAAKEIGAGRSENGNSQTAAAQPAVTPTQAQPKEEKDTADVAPAPVPAASGSGKKDEVPKAPALPSDSDLQQQLMSLKHINQSGTWILDHSELEFAVKLGSGTSGTVFKGLYKGADVAIKVLKTEQSQKELEEFKKEFQIMSSIQSPYLVFFFGACLHPRLCMVMELCSRGSLYHVLADPKVEIGWRQVFSFARQMTLGVDTLHSATPPVLHRDLKTLNLMVNDKFGLKVGDFGLSRFNTDTAKETLNKMVGTFAYCAPEVYHNVPFTTKCDVYSIVVCLWEMVYRCIYGEYQRPYQEYPHLQFDFQIIIQTAKKKVRPTIPPTCPEELAQLMRDGWNPEGSVRPTCKEVIAKLDAFEKDYEANKETWDGAIKKKSN
eukprot:TRINITY_DN2129_c0_g1_i1.p1 TRINITY_DN2129_c0_g1~~TRINITY_DN2129_c0_g1_i1.p1  ORF type:complete len:803 (+),score=234.55 TRINITY_DN2129_c0_g1_i1:116-2410(+)